jgi:hypothetical protein
MRDPYFGIDALSNSALSAFERSPAHYIYQRANPIKPTAAMNMGSLIHCLILEEDKLPLYFMILDENNKPVKGKDYRTKENKEWKDSHIEKAQKEDLILFTNEDLQTAYNVKEAVYNDPQARELIWCAGVSYESGREWTTNKGRSKFKGKLDIRHPMFLVDLKKTIDADPHEFHKVIFNRKYHRQGGTYLDGDADGHLDLANMKDFFFVAFEDEAPYGVSVHRLKPDVALRGYREYQDLTEQLQICIDHKSWKGYAFKAPVGNDGIFDVNLPNWMQND